jgi:starch synthase
MAKSLNILFVASEAYPYAKESGVADVASALPLAIRELGHDIRAMIPKYGCMSERRNRIHEINRLRELPVQMGKNKTELLTTKSSSINNTKVKVQLYVVTNEKYFESRKGIYHDPIKWTEYPDNLERFVFFSKSVLETCVTLGWYPDIIHCNDWQTALIPAYLKYLYPNKFKKTKSVLTIHNISNQGEYPLSMFDQLGLPNEAKDAFTHKKKLNIIKGGMIFANQVTTVSHFYLEQISKDKEVTNGLNSLIKIYYDRIAGIRNGIDVSVWNPKTDDSISKKYKGDFDEYKTDNKIALCDLCGLKYKSNVPLIGMVTRISTEKGIDVIVEALDELMKLDIQLVILGQGDSKIKEQLLKRQRKYSNKMSITFAFDDVMAHLVEAGSDMFLMPSRQEAFGLNLFYSLAYGSVPIVNMTGGIKDTAVPFSKKYADGVNSFAMKNITSASLVDAVSKAAKVYNDKETWQKIVKNGMDGDYSWRTSAEQYSEVYKKIMKEGE